MAVLRRVARKALPTVNMTLEKASGGVGGSQTPAEGRSWIREGSLRELRAAFLRAAQGAGPAARKGWDVERKSVPSMSDWLRLRASVRGKY